MMNIKKVKKKDFLKKFFLLQSELLKRAQPLICFVSFLSLISLEFTSKSPGDFLMK